MRRRWTKHPVWGKVLLTFGGALLVYRLTLAPDLTWENFGVDGGDLITAAYTLGVPHPPGYPTYVLLGKLFSFLPVGTVAFRFNLFSAVCMAIAAAFVTATACVRERGSGGAGEQGSRGVVAVSVGLCFAFASLVWGQAVIAEVYGLNLAVLAALVWAVVGKRPSFLVGLLLGLSLTTHLTSLLFVPLILMLTPRTRWARLIAGSVIGLLPYLLIFLFARSGSPVVWGNAGGVSGWWWLVSGQAYQGYLFGLPSQQWGERFLTWGWTLLNQFTLLGLPLLIVGGYRLWQQGQQHQWLVVGVGITAVLFTLYAIGYNSGDAIILLLPAILLSTTLLTTALESVGKLAALLPLGLLLLNFNPQNLHQTTDLRSQAIETMNRFPPHAIVITPGDATIFTLWYFQHIETVRPDLILVDSNLFAFDWYRQQLQQSFPDLDRLNRDDLKAFQRYNASARPVCHISLANPLTTAKRSTCP